MVLRKNVSGLSSANRTSPRAERLCTRMKTLRSPSLSREAPYGESNGTGTWTERDESAEMRVGTTG